jgi:hypothetical protein
MAQLYGLSTFKPLLLDLVLDTSSYGNSPHYIGCAPGKIPESEESTHRMMTAIHHVGQKVLLVVTIRLFGFLRPPAPVYAAVAGEFVTRTFVNV